MYGFPFKWMRIQNQAKLDVSGYWKITKEIYLNGKWLPAPNWNTAFYELLVRLGGKKHFPLFSSFMEARVEFCPSRSVLSVSSLDVSSSLVFDQEQRSPLSSLRQLWCWILMDTFKAERHI